VSESRAIRDGFGQFWRKKSGKKLDIRLHLQLKFAAAHLISFQTTTDQTHEAAAADGDAAVIGTMRSRRDYPRGETANLTLRNSG